MRAYREFKITNWLTELRPGDHIITIGTHSIRFLAKPLYCHHGVYLGGARHLVTDFGAKSKEHISIRPLNSFIKHNYLVKREYTDSNTDLKLIFHVLKFLKNKTLEWDLFNFNCEHYASMLCVGALESEQLNKLLSLIG
jgi:hypothetical protein